MAHKLRVAYPGAIYHVLNRGDRREAIFKDDQDRGRFLETLGEVCAKTGWEVHPLCLMRNHFRLVVEIPQGNLVAGMKWFLGTYTARFNRRHKLFGHLFSGRYKALLVDGSGNGYLKTVCAKLRTEQRPASKFLSVHQAPPHRHAQPPHPRLREVSRVAGVEWHHRRRKGEHIIRSDDGQCALWVGAVDDLWQFGKARGVGGPWLETAVKAGEPSDAHLATGYDKKRLTLSHTNKEAVTIQVEADFTGTGQWNEVFSLPMKPGEKLEHNFPAAFGAYWLRVVASADTTATAWFTYD